MLKFLITSETRIKLLLKFFLNPENSAYLRQLSSEFDESTNGIRLELKKMTEARILNSRKDGRNVMYSANTGHPLFTDIRNIILKSTGIDKVVSNIISRLGDVETAFIRGDYAKGKDSGLIELVVAGDGVNRAEIERVRKKTEGLIDRTISVLILTREEFAGLRQRFFSEPVLILLRGEDFREP